MKKLFFKLFAFILLVSFFNGCNEQYDSQIESLQWEQPPGITIAIEKLQTVMNIQDRATDALFRNPEVVGTGTGLDENGNPAIVVYTLSHVEQRADISIENVGKGSRPTALPLAIENIPVIPKATGMFKAYTDPTAGFDRPVPIGVSTGHPDITAGTIGCRVKDDQGNVYALSNNHVYANSNDASIDDNVLQPGPYDGGKDPEDAIGILSDFEEINFSGGENVMDAAIALCTIGTLGTSTPTGAGYGTPGTTTVLVEVGLNVQKYGRTTGLTNGTVDEINVTLTVCYESKNPVKCLKSALFVNQIAISSSSDTFSSGGDSGSLIVTDDNNKNPVGLLFAGSSSRTIANPIGVVLERFNVTIDDGSGSTANNPPAADFSYTTEELTASFTDKSSDSDGSVVEWNWDFGDENGTSPIQDPSYTYTSGGTYTVKLTVTDDDGATGSTSKNVTVSGPSGDGITLNATGYKVKGRHNVDLSWSGTTSAVDVYRDGNEIASSVDGTEYTDITNNVGGGSYTYKVCETESSTCSNEVTVNF